MLVVVEYRDVEFLLEDALDLEAFGSFDIFQVDAAEGRRKRADHRDHFRHGLGVDLDVKHVNVGKPLEQNALAFHDRLGGQRPLRTKPRIAVPLEITATRLAFAVSS